MSGLLAEFEPLVDVNIEGLRGPAIVGYAFKDMEPSGIPFWRQINVGKLTAVTVTANQITGGSIVASINFDTGGELVTAQSGQRVEMDSAGLRGYSSSDVLVFEVKTSGSPVFMLRSAATGQRFEFDQSGGLTGYNASGNQAYKIDDDGLRIDVPNGNSGVILEGMNFFRQGAGDSDAFGRLYVLRSDGATHELNLECRGLGASSVPSINISIKNSGGSNLGFIQLFSGFVIVDGVISNNDGISTKTVSGAPTDASYFPSGLSASDGHIAIDTTNHRVYVRSGGAWKFAALT